MNLSKKSVGLMLLGGIFVAGLLLALSPNRFKSEPVPGTNPAPASSTPPKLAQGRPDKSKPAAVEPQPSDSAKSEVEQLQERIAKLEAEMYQANPRLRQCEHFEAKLEEWQGTTGASGIINNYFVALDQSSLDKKSKSRRSESRYILANLMSPLLLKEYAAAPETAELMRWFMGMMGPTNLLPTIDRGLGIESGAQLAPQPEAAIADQVLAEIDARHEMITNTIARIAREQEFPEELVQAIRNKHLYMMLTDICRAYVHMNTPAEVHELRKKLARAETAEAIAKSRRQE